jgi:hypothetical protein
VTITSATITSLDSRLISLDVTATDNIPGVDLFVTVRGCTGEDGDKMTLHPDQTYTYHKGANTCKRPINTATVRSSPSNVTASADIQSCNLNSGECSQ